MSATRAGDVIAGAYGLADSFISQRKNDKDKAKIPIWRTRFTNPFLHLLVESTPKVECTDVTVDHWEQDEMSFQMTIKKISTSGSEHQFYVANEYADLLMPKTKLRNDFINAAVDKTAGTVTYTVATTATLKGSVQTPDIAVVLTVGEKSAVLAGYALVTVERLHQILGYTAVGYTNTAFWDSVTDGHYIFRMGKVSHEGLEAGQAVSKNMEGETNYLEKFDHEFEITDYQDGSIDQYGEPDPLARVRQQAVEDFARETENSVLFSNVGLERQVAGNKTQTFTRGINSVITSAMRRPITANSIKQVNYALRPISEIGKSMDRFMIAGTGFQMKLSALAEGHMMQSPLAAKFGMGPALQFWQDNWGKQYHIAISREMSASPRWQDSAFVINSEYLRYGYLKGKDIRIWKGPNGTGLQPPGSPQGYVKHQLTGTFGLIHKFIGCQGELYWTV